MIQTKTRLPYKIVNEILNSLTHGFGAILSVVGLIFLISKAEVLHSDIHMVAYIIFGATLIMLFLSSTIYHAFTFTKARKILRIIDHNSIFLLIAGSFTPYCLLGVKGLWGWVMYSLIWLIALSGIVQKSISMSIQHKPSKFSTLFYILMGSLSIFILYPLYQSIGLLGIGLLAAGGLTYLIGTYFYSLKKVNYMHVIWHLFVLLGASYIYWSIFLTT